MLGAVAHDDLARAIFEAVVGREFIRDRLAQFRQTGAGRVFREAGLERSDRGRLDVLRRVEVGFAGAEAADVDAFAFHRLRFAVDREGERRGQLGSARRNFHGQSVHLKVSKKGERKLWARVEVFNQRFEVVLAHLHDFHLAFGVLGRIGGVGRVDHDCLAEFLPD